MEPIRRSILRDVRPPAVASIVSDVAENRGRRTGLAAHRTLSAMFGVAERWDYIAHSPCRRLKAPAVPKREPNVPTPTTFNEALVAANEEFATLLRFAVTAGCRRGEIAGLRWGDIDWDRAIVTIRRSIDSTPGQLAPKTTKTNSSRTIPLDPETLSALRSHRERQRGGSNLNAWVWSRDHDGVDPIRPDRITSLWASLREDVPDLRGVRFQDLRHATATWLIAEGVDARTVADRLGHSDVRLTLNTYTTPPLASDRSAADTIAAVLGRSATPASRRRTKPQAPS
ncbi:MAG: site-specific integrase [Microthrixaceae bacterium]